MAGVGAQPGFEHALAEADGRFRHRDEEHGAGRIGDAGREAFVDGQHAAGPHRPVLAEHLADEQEAALGVRARGKAEQGVEFVGACVQRDFQQAGRQLLRALQRQAVGARVHASSTARASSATRMPLRTGVMSSP